MVRAGAAPSLGREADLPPQLLREQAMMRMVAGCKPVTMPVRAWFGRAQPPASAVRPILPISYSSSISLSLSLASKNLSTVAM